MTGHPDDGLVVWLRQQLDADEVVARAADPGPWEVGPNFGGRNNRVYVRQVGDLIDSIGTCVIAGQVSNMPRWRGNAAHIALQNPERTLLVVAAHRAILDLYTASVKRDEWMRESTGQAPLKLATAGYREAVLRIAAVYADRPGFQAGWWTTRPAEPPSDNEVTELVAVIGNAHDAGIHHGTWSLARWILDAGWRRVLPSNHTTAGSGDVS